MRFSDSGFLRLGVLLGSLCLAGLSAAPPPGQGGLAYRLRWEGLNERETLERLKQTSRMEGLKSVPPANLPLLQKRLQQDLPGLVSLLQSLGFYEAELRGEIDSTAAPVTVTLVCTPGPQYRIGSFDMEYTGSIPPRSRWMPVLQPGDPADALLIRAEEARLLRHLKENGHPAPQIRNAVYEIDPDSKTMAIRYEVDPGTARRFGRLSIEGLENLSPKYVRRQKPWQDDDWYDIRRIEDFEKELVLTGLFSRVRISPDPADAGTDTLDLMLTVTERHARTIRAGVNYRSDVGFGANSSWEHRNMFGRGERLKIDGLLAEEERWLSGGIRKPGFITNNQNLLMNFTARDERPDAYNSRSYNSSAGVERTFSRIFSSSLGLGYKYASVIQSGEENLYGLIYLPWKMRWDSTRSDLHPVNGHRSTSEFTPYTDVLKRNLTFSRLELSDHRYFRLRRRPQLILATRLTVGTLLGADSPDLPADERYYAGGGGSVRGYSYQSIGPSAGGDPVGGTSLLETSFELRTRFSDTWGFAGFLDGGMVGNGEIPDESFPMKWGAGAGLRIFTGIGPLRLDFAYPLNPDRDKNAQLQFYISLGQAF